MADKPELTKHDDDLAELLDVPQPGGLLNKAVYDHAHGEWHVWNGVRWAADKTDEMSDLVRGCVLTWIDTDRSTAKAKIVSSLLDQSKKHSVLEALASRRAFAKRGDEWDRQPHLIGCENGVLDLTKWDETTQTPLFIENPDPEWMISKSTGITWDPEARCDRFQQFLVEITGGDRELAAYLLYVLGYSLFGLQVEQKFWLWVGQGTNGKGTLARTVTHVLGEYARKLPDDLYMKTRSMAKASDAREDLMMLQSLRFSWMSEPYGGQFNDELLKAHSGDDPITARKMYKSPITFSPTHKIVFLTNNPPKVEDVGPSMQRRARVFWFLENFDGDKMDKGLDETLKAEGPGILRLLAIYANLWWHDGDPMLPEPEKVMRWSAEYIEENDPIGRFIADACVIGPGNKVAAKVLYVEYEDWARDNGIEPVSQMAFGMQLNRRRFEKIKAHGNIVYSGIRPRSAADV